MTIAFISHHDCFLHNMGANHPEQPARIQVIEKLLKESTLNKEMKYFQAPLAKREDLLRVHDVNYVDTIFKLSPKNVSEETLVCLDPDTWMNPYTLTAALRAAGAVILAVDLVMTESFEAAFCNVRPPGHHAERSRAMGFCFFNNIAVGVSYALNQYKLKKIAIVDFDVHHGNGTQDIFQNDPRILFCSSFQHPFYPFSGADTHNPHIINIPLPAGTQGKLFRNRVEEQWLPVISNFQPEMIFFSAGFDAHVQDEMANICLTEEDYLWVTDKVRQIADQYCPGHIISVLEGGYALEALARSALAHINALVHLPRIG